MYERLDKLREEVKRRKKMIEVAKMRLKEAEEKLREAENSQILSNVAALNLTPEQLSELLKRVTEGETVRDERREDEGEEDRQDSSVDTTWR